MTIMTIAMIKIGLKSIGYPVSNMLCLRPKRQIVPFMNNNPSDKKMFNTRTTPKDQLLQKLLHNMDVNVLKKTFPFSCAYTEQPAIWDEKALQFEIKNRMVEDHICMTEEHLSGLSDMQYKKIFLHFCYLLFKITSSYQVFKSYREIIYSGSIAEDELSELLSENRPWLNVNLNDGEIKRVTFGFDEVLKDASERLFFGDEDEISVLMLQDYEKVNEKVNDYGFIVDYTLKEWFIKEHLIIQEMSYDIKYNIISVYASINKFAYLFVVCGKRF